MLHGDDRELAVPCRRPRRGPDRTGGPTSRQPVTDRRPPTTASPRPVVLAGSGCTERTVSTASAAGEFAPA